MDGSFACPECGSLVEVRGLAPGRQVRCVFCEQLLEVPYLPRVPVGNWKRRRFGRARWIAWTMGSLGALLAVLLLIGGVRFVRKQFRALARGSIQKLLESSRAHEESGHLGEALVELDAALTLAHKSEFTDPTAIREQESRRGDLARRDARAVLDGLTNRGSAPLPLGEWLSLIARADRDKDLEPLRTTLGERFRTDVRHEADTGLTAARKAYGSGKVVESLQACDRIAKLLAYLPTDVASPLRRDTEGLVDQLLSTHGIVVESPEGMFVYGSQESYLSTMLPLLHKALEKKGYLPYRDSSPWAKLWTKARYHMRLTISERFGVTYLSSENRITRIEARLVLTSGNRLIWQTNPTALTPVPIPGLNAYMSSRLASGQKRYEDIERMLYQYPRDQIEEKFAYALTNMPPCP